MSQKTFAMLESVLRNTAAKIDVALLQSYFRNKSSACVQKTNPRFFKISGENDKGKDIVNIWNSLVQMRILIIDDKWSHVWVTYYLPGEEYLGTSRDSPEELGDLFRGYVPQKKAFFVIDGEDVKGDYESQDMLWSIVCKGIFEKLPKGIYGNAVDLIENLINTYDRRFFDHEVLDKTDSDHAVLRIFNDIVSLKVTASYWEVTLELTYNLPGNTVTACHMVVGCEGESNNYASWAMDFLRPSHLESGLGSSEPPAVSE